MLPFFLQGMTMHDKMYIKKRVDDPLGSVNRYDASDCKVAS